jgi:hypothetical protein
MHPYLRQAIAESHLDELTRSAERRRLGVRSTAPGRRLRPFRSRLSARPGPVCGVRALSSAAGDRALLS